MSRVERIEKAVERPSPEALATFRAWYVRFDATEWDRQIEADA